MFKRRDQEEEEPQLRRPFLMKERTLAKEHLKRKMLRKESMIYKQATSRRGMMWRAEESKTPTRSTTRIFSARKRRSIITERRLSMLEERLRSK